MVAIAIIFAAVLLSSMFSGSPDEDVAAFPGTETSLTGEGQVSSLLSRLTDLQTQQEREEAIAAAAAQREAEAEQALSSLFAGSAGVSVPGLPDVGDGLAAGRRAPGGGIAPGTVLTPDEIELREQLRLESVERRARSLRTPAMVQSFRTAQVAPAAAAPAHSESAAPAADAAVPAQPVFDPLAVMSQITNAASVAAAQMGGSAELPAWERTVPGMTGPAIAAAGDAVTLTVPNDPAGWERVYEGSVVSAVLTTQLSGDFAGPVEAHVSVPFYSSDRQRILIPRGSRFLGTAQPVRDQDQSRLAVGFHRLILPNGRWVDLAFHGLNAIGEGALFDQVNRHYVSMFAAAGAVGVISGLTLQGADPYGGGRAGFQAGVSQGLGQSATQILDRFLNRLPSITIRAGHRLRIWLTGDFLMPRPAAHPERMFR